jgi:hypothetical protein
MHVKVGAGRVLCKSPRMSAYRKAKRTSSAAMTGIICLFTVPTFALRCIVRLLDLQRTAEDDMHAYNIASHDCLGCSDLAIVSQDSFLQG